LWEWIQTFFKTVYNVPAFVDILLTFGVWALAAVIFAETGLMVGFFLPGDSLLVVAGLFARHGKLDIVMLNLVLSIAAITGDALGYWIGYRAGKALYNRPDSFFFRRKHLIRTHEFYEKHGGKTIVIARFMPIIRTFAPVVAGAAEMTYRRFAVYNIAGGIAWVTSMTLTGYFLGALIPNIDKHIDKVAIVIIFLSLLPALLSWLKSRLSNGKVKPGDEAEGKAAVPAP
jgi:membrane-associated protein